MANKRKFFEDFIESFGDNPDKYQEAQQGLGIEGEGGIEQLLGQQGGAQTPVEAGGLPAMQSV